MSSSRGTRRRRALAAVVTVAAVAAILVPAAPAKASFSYVWQPTRIITGTGQDSTEWKVPYTYAWGQSADCGPDSGGDGWVCTQASPNLLKYGAESRFPITNGDMEQQWINVGKSAYSLNPPSWSIDWRSSFNQDCLGPTVRRCAYPDNFYYTSTVELTAANFKQYADYEGGNWYFETGLNYLCCGYLGSTIYDTPWRGFNDVCSGCGLSLPHITQASEIINQPPAVTIGAPNGMTLHRSQPVDGLQSFSMSAVDPEVHNWRGEIKSRDPDGVQFLDDTFGGARNSSGSTATSQPVTLPRKNGTYSISAQAIDTSGTSTAASGWVSGSFTYIWNTAPSVPTLLFPVSGSTFVAGTPVPFSILSTDAENDPYSGSITVYKDGSPVATAGSLPSPSGIPSVGALTNGLAPGTYTWKATAFDQFGWTSAQSGAGSFTVI